MAGLALVGSPGHFTAKVTAATGCPGTNPTGTSTVSNLNVPVAGTYTVWSRLQIPSASTGYFLKIDNTCYKVVGSNLAANQWGWVNFENASSGSVIKANLTAGTHSVSFIGNEANVKLDRALLVSGNCTPTGTGDNCTALLDDAAPTVSLTTPANGTNLSGSVKLAATAVDDIGISKVEFLIDNSVVGTAVASPYSITWNSTTVANGNRTLTAKAYDTTGHSTASKSLTVTVDNLTASAAGSVYIALPASGDTVSGNKVGLSSGVNNLSNITKVEYFLNGTTSLGQATATDFGWIAYWDSTKVANGSYTITSRATASTTSITSKPITVKVDNTNVDTTPPTTPGNLHNFSFGWRGRRTIGWDASTDNVKVAKYYIYRDNTLVGEVPADADKLRFEITSLKQNTSYIVRVVAVDQAGNQSAPATLSIKTWRLLN